MRDSKAWSNSKTRLLVRTSMPMKACQSCLNVVRVFHAVIVIQSSEEDYSAVSSTMTARNSIKSSTNPKPRNFFACQVPFAAQVDHQLHPKEPLMDC